MDSQSRMESGGKGVGQDVGVNGEGQDGERRTDMRKNEAEKEITKERRQIVEQTRRNFCFHTF
jgi:hypothetical protein